MTTGQRLLALWKSGELARMAAQARTMADLAAQLGMTQSQYDNATGRLRAAGHDVPRFKRGGGLEAMGPDLAGYIKVAQIIDTAAAIKAEDDALDIDLSEWDEEPTNPGVPEVPAPYVHRSFKPKQRIIKRWTREDVPDGSVIGVLSDVHIPHHDEAALRLAIECLEDAGVTHAILNGDIADCGPASRHEGKRKKAVLDEGCLIESVAPGLWLYDWARTKKATLLYGNHEAWVEEYIEATPEVRGASVASLLGIPENGDGWDVLPSMSRIRLGSRCWEHGDGFFKKGNGGQNPAARMKSTAPDQTTTIGHLHRRFAMFWTNEDEYGIPRTHGAFGNGHLSRPEAHEDYMGTYLNWQQSFEITRVWWDGASPRFTTDQIEIYRDKNNRPIFEYGGKVYRG